MRLLRTHHTVRNGQQIQNLKMMNDSVVTASLRQNPKQTLPLFNTWYITVDDEGTMAVVLPHGVLFRGAAEGVIRRYLIEEKNYLEAVIGLPANIFYGTSIPTCILVFKNVANKTTTYYLSMHPMILKKEKIKTI